MDRTERRALATRIGERALAGRAQGGAAWQVWVDGSAIGATGGWAAIVLAPAPAPIRRMRGAVDSPYSRVAEAMAVLQGLRAVPDGADAEVYSDCRPVLAEIAADDRASESGLVIALIVDELRRLQRVDFRWVPAHAGAPLNVQADRLARRAALVAARAASRAAA